MSPRTKTVVDAFFAEFQVDAPPRPLALALRSMGTGRGWFSDLSEPQVSEWCADERGRIRSALINALGDARAANAHYRYEFNSSADDHIQGSCFVEPGDSETLRLAKKRRAGLSSYATHLRTLTPRDIEVLCRGVLELLGCEVTFVTRTVGDQGVDFFGRLSLEGKLGDALAGLPGVERELQVWMVGQAKHYEGRASTPDLRELAGSVALARAKVSADDGTALKDLNIRLFDPVFYLYITTGALSSASRALASRAGMIVMDGEALAAFLADRAVAVVGKSFSEKAFATWLAGLDS